VDEVVVVHVGGVGGQVELLGRRGPNQQWEFRRAGTDSSWAMLDEEMDRGPTQTPEPVWVTGWGEAVALLDRNPWAQLVPLSVHAEFRDEVLFEVTRRLLAEPSPRAESHMDRWLDVCRATAP
jgi:hypothetical protein